MKTFTIALSTHKPRCRLLLLIEIEREFIHPLGDAKSALN